MAKIVLFVQVFWEQGQEQDRPDRGVGGLEVLEYHT